MKQTHRYYRFQAVSSIFMMLALAWLTVSVPFVFAARQQAIDAASVRTTDSAQPGSDEEDDASNALGSSSEEKAPSAGVGSLSEEYLHHTDDIFHAVELFLSHTHFHSVDEYVSFHGELLCPPPNLFS